MLQIVDPLTSQITGADYSGTSLLSNLAGQALLERFARHETTARKIPIGRDAVNVVAADQKDFAFLRETNAVCLVDMIELRKKWRVEPRGGPWAWLIVGLHESWSWFQVARKPRAIDVSVTVASGGSATDPDRWWHPYIGDVMRLSSPPAKWFGRRFLLTALNREVRFRQTYTGFMTFQAFSKQRGD